MPVHFEASSFAHIASALLRAISSGESGILLLLLIAKKLA
jgi:hypothetical protein